MCYTLKLVKWIRVRVLKHEFTRTFILKYRAFTFYGTAFQTFSIKEISLYFTSSLFRVRSPLLTESRLMSIPSANEMFQFAPYFRFYWFPERRFIIHSYLLVITFRLCERPNNINLGIHSIHSLAEVGFEPTVFRLWAWRVTNYSIPRST